MKIAILVKGFPPSTLAGTEVATEHMARNLAQKGLDVHIVTVRHLEEALTEERDGYEIHRIVESTGLLGRIRYYFTLRSILNEIRPDVIHCQGLYIEAPFGVKIAKKLNVPSITFPRGSDVLEASSTNRRVLSWTMKNADLVLTQTEYMKSSVEKMVPSDFRILVLPNGIDIERFQGIDRKGVRNSYGIKENEFIFLFVGRLVDKKCPMDVIEAYNIFTKTVGTMGGAGGVRLFMVGEGENEQELKRKINEYEMQETISMIGKLDNDAIPDVMVSSDMLVLPSYAEGFPMTFLEAMASGLPIITSDDGANPEIIEDGINGLIIPLHDVQTLSQRMTECYNDKSLNERMGQNNLKKVTDYTWDSISDRLIEIYCLLVK